MSSILIHKEESRNIDSYSNLSANTVNLVSKNAPKVKRKNLLHSGLPLRKLIANTPYPNFRFFCPFCASVDVFITFDRNGKDFSVDCLDCKKQWIDSRMWKN